MEELPKLDTRAAWFIMPALIFALAFFVGRALEPADEQAHAAVEAPAGGPRFKVPMGLSQPVRGSAEALVTIVEWCDLGTPACNASGALIEELLGEYKGKLRHAYRHLAQQGSEQAILSHEFARVAHEQGDKFWQARALLEARTSAPTRADIEQYTRELGLDPAAMSKALDTHSHGGYVAADGLFAVKFGVAEGPALFVNGRQLIGAVTREKLEQLVDEELSYARAVSASGVAPGELYATIVAEGMWTAPGSPLAQSR